MIQDPSELQVGKFNLIKTSEQDSPPVEIKQPPDTSKEFKEIYIPHKLMKFSDQTMDTPEFTKHKRHVFIFTPAGKPLYSRFGDEIKLSSLFASLSAILRKFSMFLTSETKESQLKVIKKNDCKIILLFRENLCYICVTKNLKDSNYLLQNMLDFLNIQVVSLITNVVNKMLKTKENYDPRMLLGGTNNSLGNCIKNGLNSPGIFMNSFMALPMSNSHRSAIQTVIKDNRHPDLLYSILLTPINIICLQKSKDITFHPQDILLILNLLQSSSSLRTSENWIPICLPGISADGFIYAYIYFFTKNVGIIMITNEISNEMFHNCSQLGKNINRALTEFKLFDVIEQNLNNLPYSMDVFNCKKIRHILVAHTLNKQFTMPRFNIYGQIPKEAKEFLRKFNGLFVEYLKNGRGKKDFRYLLKSSDEFLGLFVHQEYCIMYASSPFIELNELTSIENCIIKWIKSEESQYFVKIIEK